MSVVKQGATAVNMASGVARTMSSELLLVTARDLPTGVRWRLRRAKLGRTKVASPDATVRYTIMTTPPSGGHDDGLVTLAQAAEQLGVHYMTAYRYVRTGRLHAEKRGGKWWVAPEDVEAVLAQGSGRRPPSQASTGRANLVDPLVGRLIVGDTAGCWDLISDALSSGATAAEVHIDLLGEALERVGEGWRRGELTVADEHRATASVYRLLGQLGPLFRHRGRRRGTVVVGTAEGDMHAIPSAILADLLCDRRFDVVDLGANTPAESFLGTAAEIDNLVGIGLCVLVDGRVDTGLQTLTELRIALPETLLVVGGPAVHRASPGKFAEIAEIADVVSASAIEACDAFDHLTAVPDPAGAAGA